MQTINFPSIRAAISEFQLSPRVEPNEVISPDRAFFPSGHRGVLDFKRQLVVGNRGMGKSFWTHALLNPALRSRLAQTYGHPQLANAHVEIGFNGSVKAEALAPTIDEIAHLSRTAAAETIWRGVILRIALHASGNQNPTSLTTAVHLLESDPLVYSKTLSALDDSLTKNGSSLLIVFDALDRLSSTWSGIRDLSRPLLKQALDLQSFRNIRAKIFMRVDQFADDDLFRFQDSSKIRNDHVNLHWRPSELYGLLIFEILRDKSGGAELRKLANESGTVKALPENGNDGISHIEEQTRLIEAISGEFMGSNKKRGRVYTWVPLHLSDAANTCSPRSFLIAWQKAAQHSPVPAQRAVDHLGLLDGVRSASFSRLHELYEDYPWIKPALDALSRQFVPIERDLLFETWTAKNVPQKIEALSKTDPRFALLDNSDGNELEKLLGAMRSVSVMEERSNGKINVPDIFRVEAQILRKGGVAVPKRAQ